VAGPKLHIDKAKIDLGPKLPIDLEKVRRKDSGVMCGPKAAFLGELKHFFPDKVSRGIVVPFGAYHAHYQNAPVSVPEKLRAQNLAKPGEPLPGFVERTYAEFFGKMIPAKKSEKELNAWIEPRLAIIRQSLKDAPLAKELTDGIRSGLDALGLLKPEDKSQTVGCFVRSDTNVEDLDNFNGAGLNLTLFNMKSLNDIYEGLKEVWASPFQFRSFSWRQTLIDDPLWVLASVVILESVPNDKSGVLVTGDIYSGDPTKMTVATSEGVGGAVDGTSAETLLWSPSGVEIVTLFKSPWRNQLQAGGGSSIVPASGSATVVAPQELEQLIAAGKSITEKFEPTRDLAGRRGPGTSSSASRTGSSGSSSVAPSSGTTRSRTCRRSLLSKAGRRRAAGACSISRRFRNDPCRTAFVPVRRAGLVMLPVAALAAPNPRAIPRGMEPAARGRVLQLLRALVLRRLRAADADPGRPHIELSRGNQVRITIPLGDKELDAYLGDLVARHKIYQELVDAKVITLSVNNHYDRFVEGLRSQGVEQAVASRESLGPEAYREKAAETLSALNPERVHRIKMPLDDVAAEWQKVLASADLGSDGGRLDAVNAALPGRLPRNPTGFLKPLQTRRSPTAVPPVWRTKELVEQLPSEQYPGADRERC
jgi:hypothetical protein